MFDLFKSSRGTGRTTALVRAALLDASKGHQIAIVGAEFSHAKWMAGKATEIARELQLVHHRTERSLYFDNGGTLFALSRGNTDFDKGGYGKLPTVRGFERCYVDHVVWETAIAAMYLQYVKSCVPVHAGADLSPGVNHQ